MDSLLLQLPLQTENDVLLVHRQAIELGKNAGLGITDQLSFSCRVTQHALVSYGPGETISFSIHQLDDRRILKAATHNNDGRVLAEAPLHPGAPPAEMLAPLDTGNRKEQHLDMQQFTMAVSHELKNSVAKIKLAVSLAEIENVPEQLRSYLDIIHRASDRMENTLRGLNDIIHLGHVRDRINTIEPDGIFEEVKDDFSHTLEQATVDVDFNEIGGFNYIDIYLRSIFNNALSNAIKYALPERPLHLKVKASREKDFVKFSFTDNGRGIDLDHAGKRLFEPFARFSTDKEGSGIGLYIVKTMAEHNGGRVEVESKPGVGSSFHFYLREY